ncbi:MAG: 23S rRNA (pseudouridine(1915)-N(3))-methyltransferase RlmH [Clostridiales bacterium]|nr:23S rRNA (pseudouridine(1915)-N(3))-methyltransferase RlmH [Clostridiales bacterium]
MNITIVCIGKLKERHWTEAAAEYVKRLGKYCTLQIDELKEEATKSGEGQSILRRVKKEDYVIALEISGTELDSAGLARKIEDLSVSGKSKVVFLIGGSDGLSEEALSRADFRLSFSKMTFPHQMMRVILLEQVYRSYKIIKNEKYHK